jgi:hypothetical protein
MERIHFLMCLQLRQIRRNEGSQQSAASSTRRNSRHLQSRTQLSEYNTASNDMSGTRGIETSSSLILNIFVHVLCTVCCFGCSSFVVFLFVGMDESVLD